MKKIFNRLLAAGIVPVFTLGVLGCGAKETTAETAEKKDGVETIIVAYRQDYAPYDYIDENGKEDGYEVAVLKKIDELLPEYEFEYVGTTDDDILIGVESGKYDVGTKGIWWTKERESSYLFPEHYIGASIVGITFRTEDADKITDLKSFAENSGKLVPIAPQNAQYNIIQNFNEQNPDTPIELVAADQFNNADSYQWVLEGRYDAFFDIKTVYDTNIADKDGEYHEFADKLSYVAYEGIPIWPLINKDNQAFADAYDKVWDELEANGTFEELSQEYFGFNIFDYVPEGYKKGDQL
ncbi:MAG: transporter substrate-binding domain-containing protein [Lachnospiraceae bacterium]|nr:transporter substrate-binding domain-containing protein [Lachnospiraceae bacterium]